MIYRDAIDRQKMWPHLLWSAGMHVCILLLFVAGSMIFLKWREDLIIVNKKLIQASVRVDVVAMPTLTLKEMQALEMKEEKEEDAAPAVVKEEAKSEEPENKDDYQKAPEQSKKSFADMLKNLSSKVDEKKSVSKKKSDSTVSGKGKLDSKSQQKLSQLLIAGNKLSQGTSLTGNSDAQDLSALESYAASLPDKIKTYWKLPTYLMEQELNCRIRVFIGPDGRLIKLELFSSSGNKEYDQRAIQSIQQSSPFSPPDPAYRDRALRGDIILGFPL